MGGVLQGPPRRIFLAIVFSVNQDHLVKLALYWQEQGSTHQVIGNLLPLKNTFDFHLATLKDCRPCSHVCLMEIYKRNGQVSICLFDVASIQCIIGLLHFPFVARELVLCLVDISFNELGEEVGKFCLHVFLSPVLHGIEQVLLRARSRWPKDVQNQTNNGTNLGNEWCNGHGDAFDHVIQLVEWFNLCIGLLECLVRIVHLS